jgi:post-segregation antitoxin (ccd killing protein)
MTTQTGLHSEPSLAKSGDQRRMAGQRQVSVDHDDLAGARGLALSVAISGLVFAAIGWGVHLVFW